MARRSPLDGCGRAAGAASLVVRTPSDPPAEPAVRPLEALHPGAAAADGHRSATDGPVSEPAAHDAEPCPHCGRPIADRYCEACGEMRASMRSRSLREFAAEAFETVTNADSRVWSTVTLLFGRPGELTVAYMEGDRNAFVRPLQLFLFANILYFVMASWLGMQSFQTPLLVHLSQTVHSGIALQLVREHLAESAVTQREYIQAFNARAAVQAKTLIIVMVPIWALLLAAVQFRRRVPSSQHLVFAMHFFAAMLVINVAQELAVNQPLVALWQHGSTPRAEDLDGVVTLVNFTLLALYLAIALPVAYGDGRRVAAVKALLLAFGFYLTLFMYRAMLFFTVYWSL
ncbi:MAG: DUF3667 domain-containing protein [Gemmatimonadaceae bacterium]|nr:DUF3667 domain-containing protein [Gemmatimonadaceae bacterium]